MREGHAELHRTAFILFGQRDNPSEEVKEHITGRVREYILIIREVHERVGRIQVGNMRECSTSGWTGSKPDRSSDFAQE